jgi:hypothetical protein
VLRADPPKEALPATASLSDLMAKFNKGHR